MLQHYQTGVVGWGMICSYMSCRVIQYHPPHLLNPSMGRGHRYSGAQSWSFRWCSRRVPWYRWWSDWWERQPMWHEKGSDTKWTKAAIWNDIASGPGMYVQWFLPPTAAILWIIFSQHNWFNIVCSKTICLMIWILVSYLHASNYVPQSP